MSLRIDKAALENVLDAFYTLSGIRPALFDREYHEIMAYPQEDCAFCACMKAKAESREKCRECDLRSFRDCTRKGELIIYKCHAGLVEAAMPLKEDGAILGYVMFGQITDQPDMEIVKKETLQLCEQYGILPETLLPAVEKVPCKSYEQIRAAAKILEACTSYILIREMISAQNDRLLEELDDYIQQNLSADIGIQNLCEALNISRTKLYKIFGTQLRGGIADYVRTKRMETARRLLKETKLPISEIALSVGFQDYNYFSRVFKKIYGKSPKDYRR